MKWISITGQVNTQTWIKLFTTHSIIIKFIQHLSLNLFFIFYFLDNFVARTRSVKLNIRFGIGHMSYSWHKEPSSCLLSVPDCFRKLLSAVINHKLKSGSAITRQLKSSSGHILNLVYLDWQFNQSALFATSLSLTHPLFRIFAISLPLFPSLLRENNCDVRHSLVS